MIHCSSYLILVSISLKILKLKKLFKYKHLFSITNSFIKNIIYILFRTIKHTILIFIAKNNKKIKYKNSMINIKK